MIERDELQQLEEQVGCALRGDDSALNILGYGEISLVLGWPASAPRLACKRLPLFRDQTTLDRYRQVLEFYIEELTSAGVNVAPTQLHVIESSGGLAGYCVQEVLPAESLGPRVLRAAGRLHRHPLIDAIVGTTAGAVSERLGFDAQLSNWAWLPDGEDHRLVYIDVTTPLLSQSGRTMLDADLFLAAFPWLMRGVLKRFVIPSMIQRYHVLSSVLLDLCANLIKERLADWMPLFLEVSNEKLERPLDATMARNDYQSDARLWEVMLRLRRFDRLWQKHVRRRVYPFLLPGQISR